MGAHISGAHYNPVVSFGLWLQKSIWRSTMLQYWIVQMVGGIAAIVVGWHLTWSSLLLEIGQWFTRWQALTVEVLFTFLLVLVIFNVAIHPKTANNQFYGLAIGLTVLAAAFAWWWISWWAFNPAVGLSSMIVGFFQWVDVSQWRLYLVGPLAWWVLASVVYGLQKGK